MGELLRVDPDRVRDLAAELADIATVTQHGLTKLKHTLAREGEFWGDDEPGHIVEDAYLPQLHKGLKGYQNLVENIKNMGTGIADTADTLEEQDRIGAGEIRSAAGYPVEGGVDSQTSPSSSTIDSGANSPDSAQVSTPAQYGKPPTQPAAVTPGTSAAGYPDSGGTAPPGAASPIPTYPNPPAESGITPPRPEAATAPTPETDEGPAGPVAAEPVAGPGEPRPGLAAQRAVNAQNSVDASATGKLTDTPWSRPDGETRSPGGPGTPWSPEDSGPPRSGRVIPPARRERRPAKVVAPSSTSGKRRRKRDRRTAAPPPVMTSGASALALAARHGLLLEGFDGSDIDVVAVRELAAAVDRIRGAYPFLTLGGIEVADLGGAVVSRAVWDRPDAVQGRESRLPWLLLERGVMLESRRLESTTSETEYVDRELYSSVIGEFGKIMTFVASPRPLRVAQRCLITEYRRISGPWDGADTLARVVDGYRQWRARLGPPALEGTVFRPAEALAAAFTEVELRGAAACDPAQVLHRLLVESAREVPAVR